ncbi:DUF6153 family protein [Streptomyces zhihengii]
MIRRQERHMPRARGSRARLLLILAVLTGVLGMHGLVSAPAATARPAAHSPAAHPGHGHEDASRTAAGVHDGGHAGHGGHDGVHAAHGGHDGGHPEHADGTCAASGLGGTPALPALAPAPRAPAPLTPATAPDGLSGPDGRGPPALSELQVLRI